jgi:hypothetical protein
MRTKMAKDLVSGNVVHIVDNITQVLSYRIVEDVLISSCSDRVEIEFMYLSRDCKRLDSWERRFSCPKDFELQVE